MPGRPVPSNIILDPPPPSSKRVTGTAVRGTKIFSTLTPILMYNPYVEIYHPLLTSISQKLGKLANSLMGRVRAVGFSQT